ncbi:MAG: methionine--tRNA ligase [Nitrospirae bacterium]|nr:MAG: methionine--tRNA ligase [Nitrospirota bacterium]
MLKTFYITTPIYYVNDVPHIGHAYTTIAADVLARYHRQWGHDVFFLTGLDEHGQKVQQAAEKAGIDPQAYCNRLAPKFQTLWKRLNISNDAFIRTTDPTHKAYVQKTLQALYDKDLIYRADYTGWYCTFDERFWTEKDVVDGLCPDCKRPVERLSESNYFFRMGRYQERLVTYIQDHPGFIQPQSRSNEVLGFLRKPLEDLSISRPKSRLSWGIELPFDAGYVTYVWFDALVNYVSALHYLTPKPSFDKYWTTHSTETASDRTVMHLVGKDILTTHAVYWSTILMALEHALPTTLFAHGWWTVNGEKMSKSRGNVVDPNAIVDEFGVDAFRYFLLREVPFGQDGDFSKDAMIGRINSELANDLGNLLSRSLTMIERFANGAVPAHAPAADTEMETRLRKTINGLFASAERHITNLEFNRALETVWELVQLGNQYIDKSAPWTLAKKAEDKARLDTVLYHGAETLRILGLALYPFMPQTAQEMVRQLGLTVDLSNPAADELNWGYLKPGTRIAKGDPLFPRIETAAKPQGDTRVTQDQQPAPPQTDQITIEDFRKVSLRIGKVIAAERVPKSTKLLKLQVDIGAEQRQIVAGIAAKYAPEDMVGKRVVIVANLKPAKLMGVESQGMVLAAGDDEVSALLTTVEDVPPGSKIK